MKRALLPLAVLPLMLMVSCDDDDPEVSTTAAGTVAVAASVPGSNTVTVVATDYKFDGLPASAPVGTRFALQNDSTEEVHEMIMQRIPDDEERTVGQIAALTEDEQNAIFGEAPPAAVIVALPGEAGQAVEGDGVVTEAGRYAVVCFIPEGADPQVVADALSATAPPTGPPDMGTGAPHIMQGMYAEIVIE